MASTPDVPWTLTARWIVPVEGPPLHRGTITIGEDRIIAVEPRGARSADRDLGNAAIVPGFVNAHTHLDLTGLRGQVPPRADFTDWLREVIHKRRELAPDQVRQNVENGLEEALQAGTTLLGDISAQGNSWSVLAWRKRIRAVVFYELLGLSKLKAHQAWAAACKWAMSHSDTSTCRRGLSPHAPYSVRASLFRAATRLARARRLPLAVHLAETHDELQLLEHRRGPFVPFLWELGVWDQQGLVKGIEEVLRLADETDTMLFAHGNYLDLRAYPSRKSSLVYCPRTHAAFGHGSYPLRALLTAGVRVALGTDSLASNPDLDLRAEARFVYEHCPDLPATTILRMATLSGAEALGWEQQTGSLVAGKSADFTILSLPSEEAADPVELVFSPSSSVKAVLLGGQCVYGGIV